MTAERRLVIALDGPAGAGKSTAGKAVARALGYRYVDTGAMYRVVGLLASEKGISPGDEEALRKLLADLTIDFESSPDGLRVIANGRDVTLAIRSSSMGQWASRVSAHPVVRARLVSMQRQLGAKGGVVMDGRDIGTVVFPSAEVKVYLDAELQERAKRRYRELQEVGEESSLAEILQGMEERDRRDATRDAAPLRPAPDAVIIDTTHLSPQQVSGRILEIVQNRVRS